MGLRTRKHHWIYYKAVSPAMTGDFFIFTNYFVKAKKKKPPVTVAAVLAVVLVVLQIIKQLLEIILRLVE